MRDRHRQRVRQRPVGALEALHVGLGEHLGQQGAVVDVLRSDIHALVDLTLQLTE